MSQSQRPKATRHPSFIDKTGREFGQWTMLEFAGISRNHETLWKCRCACGTVRVKTSEAVRHSGKQACNRCAMLAKPAYQEVERLLKAGMRPVDIAEQVGVSRQWVFQMAQIIAGATGHPIKPRKAAKPAGRGRPRKGK